MTRSEDANTAENAAVGRLPWQTVQKLVGFYVEQHNKNLPHAAFHRQITDETYFGTGAHITKQLAAAKVAARYARLAGNRAVRCPSCSEPVAISN